MLFDFDIPSILTRSILVHLRKPKFMAFLRAWTKRPENIHGQLLDVRQELIDQYGYNGLLHSLETALNDEFDPIQRNIYITVPEQFGLLWYLDTEEPPAAYYDDSGIMPAYFYLDVDELNTATQYGYEFLINVPYNVLFTPKAMFNLVDLYRYAGRRPAIRVYDSGNNTTYLFLYTTT